MPTHDNAIMRIVYYIHYNDDDDDNNNSLVGGRTGHLAGVLTGNVFRVQPTDPSKKKALRTRPDRGIITYRERARERIFY